MDRSQLLQLLLKTLGFWSFIGAISALPQAIRYSHDFADEMELLMLVAETFAGTCLLMIVGWLLIRHRQMVRGDRSSWGRRARRRRL
jgi:hypothetical protein